MKKMRILLGAFVVVSQMVPVPVRSAMSSSHSTGISQGGLQVMPATVQMPGMIQQPVMQPVPVQQPVNQVSVMPTQPMVMQQSVPVQQPVQPVVVSDQMFLQNTMNKLLGDKLKIMREKIEKYKKIIQQNATILEQKVKAFFA
jgi:hypothetical protein